MGRTGNFRVHGWRTFGEVVMNREEKKILAAAKKLARKFYDDCQELFDSDGMTDDLYDCDVMQALTTAQDYANDVLEGES